MGGFVAIGMPSGDGSSSAEGVDLPGSFPPLRRVICNTCGARSNLGSASRTLGIVAQGLRGRSGSLFLRSIPGLSVLP